MHWLHSWWRDPTLRFAAKFNVYSISLTALWTPLGTVLLQEKVTETVAFDLRDTALGVLTFVGIGIAALTEPVAGRISDGAPLPDRRKPFIVGGTLLDLLFLLFLWWAPGFGLLFAAYVLLQLSSNFAQAAFQALIPDLVGLADRGLASGVKNGYDLVGSIVGLGGVGTLLLVGLGLGSAYLFLGAVLLLGAGLSAFWVPRVSPLPPDQQLRGLGELVGPQALSDSFRLDFRAHRVFVLVALNRFLFLFGLFPVQRFFLFFAQQRFGVQGLGETVSYYFLALIVVGALAAAAAGTLSDRIGRTRTLQAGVIASAAGLVGVAFSPSLPVLIVPGAAMAIGLGTFQAVNWALLSDFIPGGQGARFYGYANVATAGASAMAGLFGPLIMLLGGVAPDRGYQFAFVIAAALAVTSLLPLRGIIPNGREDGGGD